MTRRPNEIIPPSERPDESHQGVHSKLVQDSIGTRGEVRTERPVAGADALLAGVDPTTYISELSSRLAPRVAALRNVVDPHVLGDWAAILNSCRDPRANNDTDLASAQDVHLRLMQRIAGNQTA
ncbi:MAG: hypothetical protein C5B53_10295 [Candidatus Melainabacteria bacterium]|nr:MAG: hypothetical protein C5B53_10295 [Candidatus Melainabacteria bacterium]